MKRRKLFPVLRHAFTMVMRTIRSYIFLSVTIMLSFSLLLGYLIYTDSSTYNEYKELFSMRRGDVIILDNQRDNEKMSMLIENLDSMDGIIYYIAYNCHMGHDAVRYDGTAVGGAEGTTISLNNIQALLLPDFAWVDGMDMTLDIYGISSEIVWLDSTKEQQFSLAADEVILSEKVFFALGLNQEESPLYTLRSTAGPTVVLKVVGYTKSANVVDYGPDSWVQTPAMILSTKFIEATDLLDTSVWTPPIGKSMIYTQYLVIHSENPEQVIQLAKDMNYTNYASVFEKQDSALESIRVAKANKAIIACALLLLLGINLYSSFSNALNERKFEIGVKRAMGASAWCIVKQFLYESIIVMITNIVVAVTLVVDAFALLKFITERTPNAFADLSTWIIYISPYSVAIFAVCAFTLTLVFSLIFAYKSTQVEIIKYLKAE